MKRKMDDDETCHNRWRDEGFLAPTKRSRQIADQMFEQLLPECQGVGGEDEALTALTLVVAEVICANYGLPGGWKRLADYFAKSVRLEIDRIGDGLAMPRIKPNAKTKQKDL